MQNRRDFLKTAALAAIGSGLIVNNTFAEASHPASFSINRLGKGGKMKMKLWKQSFLKCQNYQKMIYMT